MSAPTINDASSTNTGTLMSAPTINDASFTSSGDSATVSSLYLDDTFKYVSLARNGHHFDIIEHHKKLQMNYLEALKRVQRNEVYTTIIQTSYTKQTMSKLLLDEDNDISMDLKTFSTEKRMFFWSLEFDSDKYLNLSEFEDKGQAHSIFRLHTYIPLAATVLRGDEYEQKVRTIY